MVFQNLKKATVINHPGATSDVKEEELEATVEGNSKIKTLIVHAVTNDLTNNINNLRSVKKICKRTKKDISEYEDCLFKYYIPKR